MRFIRHNPHLNIHFPDLSPYRAAWDKCLAQITNIVQNIYAPSIAAISASNNSILGLPYPELPLIAINNATSSSLFVSGVLSSLTNDGSIAIHLYHSDTPNLPTAMKNLISAFINSIDLSSDSIPKSTRSATPYDIRILYAWYTTLRQEYGNNIKLIVVLHDFEQFDVTVMQELFAICSTPIQQSPLPFLFITLLSSPPSPSYIHTVYSRTTLTKLCIDSYSIPSGPQVIDQIILETFFNLDFEPDLMLGPTILSTILNYVTRYNSSVDTLITMLQLAHLKHFLIEPLSIFTSSSDFNNTDPTILNLLSARLSLSLSSPIPTKEELKTHFQTFQTQFQLHLHHIRISFHLLHLIQVFFESNGYKGLGWNVDDHNNSQNQSQGRNGLMNAIINILKGRRMNRDIQSLNLLIRKLRPQLLHSLITTITTFFSISLPSKLRKQELEEQIRIELVLLLSRSRHHGGGGGGGVNDEVDKEGKELADLLCDYLTQLLKPIESLPLWDIWYTGMMTFPIEMINPNIKSTILSGLSNPINFIQPLPLPNPSLPPLPNSIQNSNQNQNQNPDSNQNSNSKSLWNNPDTTILYRLYQDSGRNINIHDWYEAFRGVLEFKRDYLISLHLQQQQQQEKGATKIKLKTIGKGKGKKSGKGKGNDEGKSSIKSNAKGKGKQKELELEHQEQEQEPIEQNEETWNLELQSRFLRSLHELDHLGFIKHTGRKIEHVIKTVFDIRDDSDSDHDDAENEVGEE